MLQGSKLTPKLICSQSNFIQKPYAYMLNYKQSPTGTSFWINPSLQHYKSKNIMIIQKLYICIQKCGFKGPKWSPLFKKSLDSPNLLLKVLIWKMLVPHWVSKIILLVRTDIQPFSKLFICIIITIWRTSNYTCIYHDSNT